MSFIVEWLCLFLWKQSLQGPKGQMLEQIPETMYW